MLEKITRILKKFLPVFKQIVSWVNLFIGPVVLVFLGEMTQHQSLRLTLNYCQEHLLMVFLAVSFLFG